MRSTPPPAPKTPVLKRSVSFNLLTPHVIEKLDKDLEDCLAQLREALATNPHQRRIDQLLQSRHYHFWGTGASGALFLFSSIGSGWSWLSDLKKPSYTSPSLNTSLLLYVLFGSGLTSLICLIKIFTYFDEKILQEQGHLKLGECMETLQNKVKTVMTYYSNKFGMQNEYNNMRSIEETVALLTTYQAKVKQEIEGTAPPPPAINS